jgi:hypothetical protein
VPEAGGCGGVVVDVVTFVMLLPGPDSEPAHALPTSKTAAQAKAAPTERSVVRMPLALPNRESIDHRLQGRVRASSASVSRLVSAGTTAA